ncbi:MAG TPA: DnaJ domain-containing protein [Acidimicrobiia bacterium]|nr:DnaJ domain-containing protein [Acidimicrobiia bacterium]
MPTGVRDWATVDYYALLGVPADASADDIARAFRTAAKVTHPDATSDPVERERFKELATAYRVLADRRTRRDYDEVRRLSRQPPKVSNITTRFETPEVRAAWSHRRALTVLIAGIVVTVLGIGMAYLTWSLHEHDANRKAKYIAVEAVRVGGGDVRFDTLDGHTIQTHEPTMHGEGAGLGSNVAIRYDPADPQHVVLDASTFGRDITLAIVALKLLIGGPVFVVLGARRLRGAR